MVIKFREDSIKKLEKSLKAGNLASEDTNALIVSMVNERQFVLHTPLPILYIVTIINSSIVLNVI